MTKKTPEKTHRSQLLRHITLPAIGGVALVLVLVMLAVLTLNPTQFGLLADTLAISFILLPIAIACLIPTLLLLAAALWVMLSLGGMAPPLARGRNALIGVLANVQQQVPRIAAPILAMQNKLAYWEHVLTKRPQPVPPEEEQPNGR